MISALAALKSGDGLKGRLMRGGAGAMAVRLSSTGFNLVLAILLARLLGADGYGVYSFVFAVLMMLAIPAQMGLPHLMVRETAKARANERWDVIRGLWAWSARVAVGLSLALLVLGGVGAYLIGGGADSEHLATFYWGLALVPLIALGNLRGAALRGLHHVVQGLLPEFLLRPLFFAVLVILYVLTFGSANFGAADAMMLHVWGAAAAFLIGALLLVRAQPAQLRAERASTTHSKTWLSSVMPLGLTEGVYIVNVNAGIVIIGMFFGPEEVAMARAAAQASIPLILGMRVVETLVAPYFANFQETDIGRLNRLYHISRLVGVAIALPVALVYFAGGTQVIEIVLGADFLPMLAPLVILTIARLVEAFIGPSAQLLRMTGREKFALQIAIVSMIANVILLFILVPPLGATGMAIATGLTIGFLSIAAYVKAKRDGLIAGLLGS